MRIKLNFADIHSYLESSLSKSWFLLDPDNVKTVADLAKELTHRFRLKCNSDSLLLTLDDCLLPDWESTWILRDDDTVRIRLVQHSCQSKHKKRKQHFSEDNYEHASSNSAAELSARDVDTPTLLVADDHSQESHVSVEKKTKFKSRSHSDGHSLEDGISSNNSLRHSEGKRARHRKKATNECSISSPQNLETFPADQNGLDNVTADRHVVSLDPLEVQATWCTVPEPDNREYLMQAHSLQPEAALHASESESVDGSSMTATLTPVDNQVNDSNFVSDEQQLKLSHSAKRRRRRHRAKKCTERKDEGDVSSNEQSKNTSAPVDSSLQNVSLSNELPIQASHSLESGFGRTHIIFNNANSDDESGVKAIEAHPTTHLACDKYDSGTSKANAVSGSDTVIANSIVNNSSDTEAHLHSQNENAVSDGLVSCDVRKASSAAHLPRKTKVCSQAINTPFANVQVFCRQRIKKSDAAAFIPHGQPSSRTTTLLPKQANYGTQAPAVKDYSHCCSLQGTPRAGDLIAYKMIEMTDDYTPAMSQYKEATVIEFNPVTNMVVLQASVDDSRKKIPGRFDVSIEYEDEILTNVCHNSQNCVSWTALHDVRLLK